MLFCVNIVFAQHSFVLLNKDTISPLDDSAAHVIFPCNKTYFYKNQKSWLELKDALHEIYNDSSITLKEIHMYGAASPEGPYNNNVYLAKNRLKRVTDSLRVEFPDIDKYIKSYFIPEDYIRLIYVTQNDSLYQNISELIGENDFITKKNLQKDRKAWRDLLKRYYPNLRAVNVVIYADKVAPKRFYVDIVPPEINTKVNYLITDNIIKPSFERYCLKQPMLRLKTNLIYDCGIVPNFAIEFLPKNGHFTPEVKFMWAGWRNDDKFRTWIIHSLEASTRYYISKNVYTGWFLNTCVGLGTYDIQLNKNRAYLSKKCHYNNKFEIGGGYVYNIKDSGWTLETTIGLGIIYSRYNRYHAAEDWATPGEFYYDWHEQPEQFRKYNHRLLWFGPVNFGITISYDIIHYKKQCVSY